MNLEATPPEAEKTAVAAATTPLPGERQWMLRVALFTMLLTLLPYLIGWSLAQGRQFMWLGHNLDDSCVYLSWMRQAADGSLRALNLFTTDPQHGMLLNPLFLTLGWFARLTHLPLLAVYHIARFGFGFGLLVVIWKFLEAVIADPPARRLAFLCVCFASGVGWLPFSWSVLPTPTCPPGPIDFWQPEAITFLSLLLSPLFCFSMLLQVATLLLLFKGLQTGKMVYAVWAGCCGLLLGLTHTYDVLSLSAIWIVYLVVRSTIAYRAQILDNIHAPRRILQAWLQAALAGAITAPGVAYIYHELLTEATFQKRANVVTASPALLWVFLGYGFTLVFAVIAVTLALRSEKATSGKLPDFKEECSDKLEGVNNGQSAQNSAIGAGWATSREAFWLLVVWMAVNILIAYLPVAKFPFQRKMLQGAHFPIAILAGIGIAWLLAQPALRRQFSSVKIAALLLVVLLGLTNLRFTIREITDYRDNRTQSGQRPYLNPGEIEALDWIQAHAPAEAAIQPLPWVVRTGERSTSVADTMSLACFTPGLIHHPVYCGHWGETPDFGVKLQQLMSFMNGNKPEELRLNLLRQMKVRYLIFSQKNVAVNPEFPFPLLLSGSIPVPSYLELVHSNHDADVYQVNLPPPIENTSSSVPR